MTDCLPSGRPAFETDHEANPGLDIVRTVAVLGSALLHLAVAAVALPYLPEPVPRLSASTLELTVELPLPLHEEAGARAGSTPAARAVPGATDAGPRAAPQLASIAAPTVRTPAPTEPYVAIVLPSAEPPPSVTSHDFATGPKPAAEQDSHHAFIRLAEGASMAGHGISRIAPPSSGSAPALDEQTVAEAAQGKVREDRPKRAVQQNQKTGTTAAALAASRPAPARADAPERRVHQARQDYLARLVAQLSRQRFDDSSGTSNRGVVLTRLDIARDGRLIDVVVLRSSGHPTFDHSVATAIRRSAPFPPLPPDLAPDRITFVVPISYALER